MPKISSVAQKVQVLFIGDLDGRAAEGTVRFGLDRTDYEIALNAEHEGSAGALTRYIGTARRVGSKPNWFVADAGARAPFCPQCEPLVEQGN